MRFLTGLKKLKIETRLSVFSRPMKFNFTSYRWPIAVFLFSLILIVIQFKYFEAKAPIDIIDVLTEGSVAIMLFVALFVVWKLRDNSSVYMTLGITLFYFSFFTDASDEFFNQPDYFKYLFEDALQILGAILFVFGVWRWVANKNLTENKLRLAYKYLDTMLLNLPAGAAILEGPKLRYFRINKMLADMNGLSVGDHLGKTVIEVLPEAAENIIPNLQKVLNSGEPILNREFSVRLPSNPEKTFHLIDSHFPIKIDGKVKAVGVVVTDVTEQKKAEEKIRILKEKYKNLYENTPVMYMSLNMDGIIIECNKTILDKLGYVREEFIDRHMTKFTTKESAASFKKDFPRLLETGKLLGAERQLVTKSGKIVDVILNVTMEYDKNQNPISTRATFENITDRKKIEEKLKLFNEKLEGKVKERTQDLQIVNKNLERANEIKADFIADASHELRTPLSIIKLNLDLALRESSRDVTDPYEAMSTIHNEVGLMTNIISDLTFLSRADAGDVSHLRYRDIQLGELLTRVVKSAHVMSGGKNLSIYIDNLDEVYVRGDEAALERLFMNLISNAVKYNYDNGWVRLTLTNDNKYAVITVTDNGIGISDEDLPRVFERFYRADKARSRESGGTGLGLSICRWVAEVHNGTIDVKSEVGKGSEFTVKLSLSKAKT